MAKIELSKAISILESNIPNIHDYYNNEEITKRFYNRCADSTEETLVDDFVSEIWDEPVRRCSVCGKLFNEGYYLDPHYACSDECRNKHIMAEYDCKTEEEAIKTYLYMSKMLEDEYPLDEWMKLSLDECMSFDNGEVSDYFYYSLWN